MAVLPLHLLTTGSFGRLLATTMHVCGGACILVCIEGGSIGVCNMVNGAWCALLYVGVICVCIYVCKVQMCVAWYVYGVWEEVCVGYYRMMWGVLI